MYLGSASSPALSLQLGRALLSSSSSSSSSSSNSSSPPWPTPGTAHVPIKEPLDHSLEWLAGVFKEFWALILSVVQVIVSWVDRVGASLPMRIFEALCKTYEFITAHPHPFHVLCWALFFGPIIILIPCLLLIELLILVLFQLSFMSHGMRLRFGAKFPLVASGPLPDRFDALREHFMEWRESLFATVEHWTATFNKWTVDHPLLLVLRLAAGAGALAILLGLWSEVPLGEIP